jgi:signal transduction histidine kinase
MVTGIWRAMAEARFLLTAWPWRSLAYVLSTIFFALFAWSVFVALLVVPPLLPFIGVPIGAVERYRLRLLMSAQVRNPHRPAPADARAWVRLRARERATWRELGYAASLQTVLLLLATLAAGVVFLCLLLLTLPLSVALSDPGPVQVVVGSWTIDSFGQACAVAGLVGIPATAVALYGISILAGGLSEFAGWLLAPSGQETSRQVAELSQSRNRLVNAFEAERRRIERDLHDGAQQHLLLLSMQLSLAELELAGSNERAGAFIGEAQQQARLALAAIREQIRGIHPQILTDFGLAEAVRELAERCVIPVEVNIDLPERLPSAIESTAYFVVSEAVTNVVRHAAAGCSQVTGKVVAQRLCLTVVDDGRGGADPATGTGLRGLADRLAVMDGTLEVDSPPGGPTVLRIELPCRYE